MPFLEGRRSRDRTRRSGREEAILRGISMSSGSALNDIQRIKYGAFATPPRLAECLALLAFDSPESRVLDPAYGGGALLLAACKRLMHLGSKRPGKRLFGFDIRPWEVGTSRRELLKPFAENLKQCDFFSRRAAAAKGTFDVVLMNPPFVRHHALKDLTRERIRRTIDDKWKLPRTSNLWAYFVLHSLAFLREQGTLGAILPWSLLYADFATPVRRSLAENFETISATVIGGRPFGDAEERVLVLVCKGLGSSAKRIEIGYSTDVPEGKPSLNWTSHEEWLKRPTYKMVGHSLRATDVGKKLVREKHRSEVSQEAAKPQAGYLVDLALEAARDELGFRRLDDFAAVSIGTVTGANRFFILDRHDLKALGIPARMTSPVVAHARDLPGLWAGDSEVKHVLLLVPEGAVLPKKLASYVKEGERQGLDKRSHAKKRDTWYCIPKPTPPPAFLCYMVKEVPFMVPNSNGVFSTNTIHQVWFRDDVTQQQRRWIQLSTLTSVFQLSAELIGRTYGGGVLKIEPTSARELLVYPGGRTPVPKDEYDKIAGRLADGDKAAAMAAADAIVRRATGASSKTMRLLTSCFRVFRDARLGVRSS